MKNPEAMNRLDRFVEAQETDYDKALQEIRNGAKRSHWMWYIFPQVRGLGRSAFSTRYGLDDITEANAYLQHPVLGPRLVQISKAVLQLNGKTAHDVFGSPDDLKLRSCMTLFATLEKTDPVFDAVLQKFFAGKKDSKTLDIINHAPGIK